MIFRRWSTDAGIRGETEFLFYFSGQLLSALGDSLVPIALTFAVLGLGYGATGVGVVMASQTGPMVALILLGGVIGDRVPRRRVMVSTDTVRACIQAVTAALLLSHRAQLWELCVLGALYGTATAFFNPASSGLIRDLVNPRNLQRANGLIALSRNGSRMVGPLLSGLLVAFVGTGTVFAVDSVSFLASAGALSLVPAGKFERPHSAAESRSSVVHDLRDGWRTFRELRWVFLTVCFFSGYYAFALAPFFVLGPVEALSHLGGAISWSVILVAAGSGNIVGSLASMRYRMRKPLVGGILGTGIYALLLLGLAIHVPLAVLVVVAFVTRVSVALFATSWSTLLQTHVPEKSLSRVSAYDWLGSTLFFPVGLLLWGPVASALGTSAALGVSAFVFAAVAVFVATRSAVREITADESESIKRRPGFRWHLARFATERARRRVEVSVISDAAKR